MQQILDAMTGAAAFLRNGRLDVLTANQLGYALYSPVCAGSVPPVNLARFIFLDPRSNEFYADWDGIAPASVGSLRTEAGRDPYDRDLTDLVGELSTRSEDFRVRWAAHDVEYYRSGVQPFHRPIAGDLTLDYDALEIPADPGLTIIAYTAKPGTPSEHGLKLLANRSATTDEATAGVVTPVSHCRTARPPNRRRPACSMRARPADTGVRQRHGRVVQHPQEPRRAFRRVSTVQIPQRLGLSLSGRRRQGGPAVCRNLKQPLSRTRPLLRRYIGSSLANLARGGKVQMQCKEATVMDRPEDDIRAPEATEGSPLPPVTDRATWQAQIDELAVREKAHTREGDAIAAARRRLPMVEIDGSIPVIGERGRVPLLDVFEGRRQLVVYYHMWHDGKPAEDQCEGCTFFNGQVSELSYLHARDVTYATFSQGRYEESAAYRRFMGYDMPWYSARESEAALLAGRWFGMLVSYLRDGSRVFETYWTTGRGTEVMAPAYGILDRTIYGRQEPFEDSPEGWPQHWANNGSQFRTNGRPSAQWSRLAAGRPDDLTASPTS